VPSATQTPTPSRTLAPTATQTPSQTPAPTDTTAATAAPIPSPSQTPAPTGTPAASSTVAPASPIGSAPFIHVVQPGDTLYDIALTYGTTVEAIMAANGLQNSQLHVGQQLMIPSVTATPTPP